ncbi:MAG TPA: hypothetical protein VFL70_00700, partial [Bacteroidia bacterium]|nr:hypothetical protein [Bacteroidia bacterium]
NAGNINLSPFRPGMSATVEIHIKTAVNVLSLPIQAVTTRSDSAMKANKEKKEEKNDFEAKVVDEKKEKLEKKSMPANLKPQECVFIYKDGKVTLRKVKTGVQDNSAIEITEGLTENDEVVTGPYNAVAKLLKDGMEVKKTDIEDVAKSWKKE